MTNIACLQSIVVGSNISEVFKLQSVTNVKPLTCYKFFPKIYFFPLQLNRITQCSSVALSVATFYRSATYLYLREVKLKTNIKQNVTNSNKTKENDCGKVYVSGIAYDLHVGRFHVQPLALPGSSMHLKHWCISPSINVHETEYTYLACREHMVIYYLSFGTHFHQILKDNVKRWYFNVDRILQYA